MSKKKDSASKRFERAKKQPLFSTSGGERKVIKESIVTLDANGKPVEQTLDPNEYDGPAVGWAVDWRQCPPEDREKEANRATTLGIFDKDADLLRRAFDEHHLDHHNPWNWRGLLFTCIAALKGIKPEGGRPPEWTPGDCERFTDDYNAAVIELHGEGHKRLRPQTMIAERMKKKFPGRYPQKPATLVKYFSSYLVKDRMRK